MVEKKAKRGSTPITSKARTRFLTELRETANVAHSARMAGHTRNAFYFHRSRHPEFAEAWEDAMGEAVDNLEAEARRRAMDGYKAIAHVTQNGKVTMHTVYSDRLMEVLLKGHRPERYVERMHLSGPGGAPIQISFSDLVSADARNPRSTKTE